ncbi:MAG: C69 family dipeptidase [Acidimicrobiia bacterium]
MCDTLCAVGRERTLFAKNSDRAPSEAQVLEALPGRVSRGTLRTQYLEIEDADSVGILGSRPVWLWGLEHGVNANRVAIGNEQVWTIDEPDARTPGLLGIDLVRLGLERARSADHAVDVITALLERHGQSGAADGEKGEAYFSSFLVADPAEAWVVETSNRTWVAKRVGPGENSALTNRLTLRYDWERSSVDVAAGSDFDAWRDPSVGTLHADRRLEAAGRCLKAASADDLDLGVVVRHLRDHDGDGPPPQSYVPFGEGVTVCMHLGRHQATTASMVAELPADPERPVRAWAALGSPCVSIYLPCLGAPAVAPGAMSRAEAWQRFADLARATERDPLAWSEAVPPLRRLEQELWEEADALSPDVASWRGFVDDAWARVENALDRALAVVA